MPIDVALYATLFACWCAGMGAAKGVAPTDLLALLPMVADTHGYEPHIGSTIAGTLRQELGVQDMASCRAAQSIWIDPVAQLFHRLGKDPDARYSMRYWSALAYALTEGEPPNEPWFLGPVVVVLVDPARLRLIELPPGVDTVLLWFRTRSGTFQSRLGPVWGDLEPASQLRILLQGGNLKELVRRGGFALSPAFWAAGVRWTPRFARSAARIGRTPGRRAWRIRSLLKETVSAAMLDSRPVQRPDRESFSVAGRLVADARAAAARPAVEADSAGEAHSEIEYREAGGNSRKEFWELFFETKDPWNYGSRYEQVKYEQTLSLLPDAALGRALEIACAEGMFTEKLAPRVGHLFASDISSKALQRAAQRCAAYNNVEYLQLDLIEDDLPAGTST